MCLEDSVGAWMTEATARHILVDSIELCEELKMLIEEGGDFAELARLNSTCPSGEEGGSLGTVEPGKMVKEVDEAIFSAEVGKLIGPIKTEFGYHLIEVTSRED